MLASHRILGPITALPVVTYDTTFPSTTGSWTHTTGSAALTNAMLFVTTKTTQNNSPATTLTVNGTSILTGHITNTACVNSSGDTMGTWLYALALGSIAASQAYAIVVSGGAGSWTCQSVVFSHVQQTINGSFTVAGFINDSDSVPNPSVTLSVPTNGAVLNDLAAWELGGGTLGGSATVLKADSSGTNGGYYGTQYSTSASAQSWTFSNTAQTVCLGSWGIPAG